MDRSNAVRETSGAIAWPTRRACVDCHTVRGKLRRACPYCWRPVCDDCYPLTHHEGCERYVDAAIADGQAHFHMPTPEGRQLCKHEVSGPCEACDAEQDRSSW